MRQPVGLLEDTPFPILQIRKLRLDRNTTRIELGMDLTPNHKFFTWSRKEALPTYCGPEENPPAVPGRALPAAGRPGRGWTGSGRNGLGAHSRRPKQDSSAREAPISLPPRLGTRCWGRGPTAAPSNRLDRQVPRSPASPPTPAPVPGAARAAAVTSPHPAAKYEPAAAAPTPRWVGGRGEGAGKAGRAGQGGEGRAGCPGPARCARVGRGEARARRSAAATAPAGRSASGGRAGRGLAGDAARPCLQGCARAGVAGEKSAARPRPSPAGTALSAGAGRELHETN
nr:translation initiation factor IF-2-like [Symphalangus syndactylus]